MAMLSISHAFELKKLLLMVVGALFGGAITVVINRLPFVQASLLSAVAIGSLVVGCAYLANTPHWRIGFGAIAGILVGVSGMMAMATHLAGEGALLQLGPRLLFAGIQVIAGTFAGVILARRAPGILLPSLKDLLVALSGLTVGLYGFIVTGWWILHGEESARLLFSRLTVSTTILFTLIAAPGALGYFLARRRKDAAIKAA